MNERVIVLDGEIGQVGQTLTTGEHAGKVPVGATLVYAEVKASVDDAGLTATVKGGSTALTSAIDCATAATPGVWKSKHFGGTADSARVAADTAITIDFANAAADTRAWFALWFILGEA